jgi:hypothetical protein
VRCDRVGLDEIAKSCHGSRNSGHAVVALGGSGLSVKQEDCVVGASKDIRCTPSL